jgi:FAD/FMN-containing dehydrogenase
VDRREFLRRAGAAAVVVAAGSGWELARGATDPRLRALARAVRGPVLAPGTAAYEAARAVSAARFAGAQPLGVVQPLDVHDVQQAVLWARRNGVRPIVRSGGHSYAGYSTGSGLVIDLSRLAGVSVAAGGATAAIGAGARLIDVYSRLAARGATIPAGSCPTVAVGGLALGGGVGFSSRLYGTTADNVLALGIVTSDGRHRVCAARSNADLFWACRGGGGGNFGVVTSFTFRLHPAPPVAWFVVSWPWERAADVIGAWQSFAPDASDELFSICSLGAGRSAQPTVQCFGQYFGAEERLRTLIATLERVDGARVRTGTSSFLDAQRRWEGCLAKTELQCRAPYRATFAAKSHYFSRPLDAPSRAAIVSALEEAQRLGFGSGSLLLDSYGGAINRVAPQATAFVHRRERCSGQFLAYWDGDGATALGWLRRFHAALRPAASGFAYQNYIDPELTGWEHAYYGVNLPRLRAVKRRYDPENLFRFRQSIRPG